MPVLAEDLEMKKLINTYGKTFHTWQVDRGDTLPLGMLPCCPPPAVLPEPSVQRQLQLMLLLLQSLTAASADLCQAVIPCI